MQQPRCGEHKTSRSGVALLQVLAEVDGPHQEYCAELEAEVDKFRDLYHKVKTQHRQMAVWGYLLDHCYAGRPGATMKCCESNRCTAPRAPNNSRPKWTSFDKPRFVEVTGQICVVSRLR